MEIQQETVTIASIIANIKTLKVFADDKYNEIEDFYRHDNNGRVFNSPMNVPAGHVGGNNRGDMMLQNNAYLVAKDYYFTFLMKENPTEIIDALIKNYEKEKFTPQSKQINGTPPLEDRFCLDIENFIENLKKLQQDLNQVSKDEAAWRECFTIIFNQQSVNLINKYGVTTRTFNSALQAISKDLTEAPELLTIDIDYLYRLSRMITPTVFSLSTNTSSGKTKTHTNIDSRLTDYLKALKYVNLTELFQQVFEQCYYEKEYEVAYKNASSNAEGEEPRWTVEQLRKPKPKNHETKQPEESNSQKEEDANPNQLN